ncbi:hypothetical protein FB451DRAFT_1404651 [Mycena latifolia]|nr:hypothetical protein FB451DRAFT_1404651 [Mycena latifolia]
MNCTDYRERMAWGAGAAFALVPLRIASSSPACCARIAKAYRLSPEAMPVIMEQPNSRSSTDRTPPRRSSPPRRRRARLAMHACEIKVALTHKARERAADASRPTDEKSDSTTPHAALAGAPRGSAGRCACVARGAGVGVPAKPLRLVATKTRAPSGGGIRAVCAR